MISRVVLTRADQGGIRTRVGFFQEVAVRTLVLLGLNCSLERGTLVTGVSPVLIAQ